MRTLLLDLFPARPEASSSPVLKLRLPMPNLSTSFTPIR